MTDGGGISSPTGAPGADCPGGANEALAVEARRILLPGEMGNLGARGDEYERYLDESFGNGKSLRTVRTSCAIFVGAARIHSGWAPKRPAPAARAITTWAGVPSFGGRGWISVSDLAELRRGDIAYWCSSAGKMGKYVWSSWPAAANGHVGICISGAGFAWALAQGGGSPGGTMCRLSTEAKDLRKLSRPLRGVWRPDLLHSAHVPDTEPAPAPTGHPTLRMGSQGQAVKDLQTALGGLVTDGDFGPKTEGGVQDWQRDHGLSVDGICGAKTWATLVLR